MSIRHRALATLVVTFAVMFVVADLTPHATDGPLLLFGGRNHEEFIGCLNCYRSEPFSVWNESRASTATPKTRIRSGTPERPLRIAQEPAQPLESTLVEPPARGRPGRQPVWLFHTRIAAIQSESGATIHIRNGSRLPDAWSWLLDNYDWVVSPPGRSAPAVLRTRPIADSTANRRRQLSLFRQRYYAERAVRQRIIAEWVWLSNSTTRPSATNPVACYCSRSRARAPHGSGTATPKAEGRPRRARSTS